MGQNDLAGLMANGLHPVLLALCLVVFLFDLVRSKFWTVDLSPLKSQLKLLLAVAGFLAAIFAVGFSFQYDFASYWPYAALGLAGVYLSGVIDPSKHRNMRTTFLLGISAALVTSKPEHLTEAAAAFSAGMLAWKVMSNFTSPQLARLDDVAASFAYLASMACATSTLSTSGRNGDIIAGAFATAVLLNLMQRPFMHDDKLIVKRLVLTIAGGLGMLVVLTKGLNALTFTNLAVLVGAGFGSMYALDALGRMAQDERLSDGERAGKHIKALLIVGIFTLLSTRLFGNLGLAVISACVMVSAFTQLPACAAMFFGARLMEQAFAAAQVSNVTGINLQHSYVSAAQYLGFFVVMAVMVMIRYNKERRIDAAAITLLATFGTGLASFFLHAEPAAGYLVALGVAGVVGAVLLQTFFGRSPEDEARCLSVILIPSLAGSCAVLSGGLVAAGLTASMEERLTTLGVLAGLTVVLLLLSHFFGKSRTDTVTVAGD
ncbi:MAG: hypothetical protein HY986_20595 [Candidatus Melainabacteria bacterium]|nr:hypothetical protein [Candidatus Melainabacteria bacterium]